MLFRCVDYELSVTFGNWTTDEGKLELRVKMGNLYTAFIGIPTSHYYLDFEKPLHLKGGKKLAALSVADSKAQVTLGGNTSQRGIASCFRNEQSVFL